MSRTFRNRHLVPAGWVVWDGQPPRMPGCACLHEPERVRGGDPECLCRHGPPNEAAWRAWRQLRGWTDRHQKAYRRHVRDCLRDGRWEDILPFRAQRGGWW